MVNETDIARAILAALTDAQMAGLSPVAIALDTATQEGLNALGLGYWSAGPATWSLFKVPVVLGAVQGWQLRFSSGTDAAS